MITNLSPKAEPCPPTSIMTRSGSPPNQLATRAFSIIGDVHDRVADRLAKITNGPILDLGGGNGVLAKSLARLSTKEASLQARQWNTPLTVTKRGCLIWARRP